MKYVIEVHAMGYENYTKVVEASSMREAMRHEREAKVEWCEHNAIDLDSNLEMPFTRITKL